MEQRCETCSLVFDSALGACPTCGAQTPGPELELDWGGRTRAPVDDSIASVPPPDVAPEPELAPAVPSTIDVDDANFALLVRGVDWVLLTATLVEFFLGGLSFLGAALNLLGAATSDVYLLSTNRLIILMVGTAAAMLWTASLIKRRHGDALLRTLGLWLVPWFGPSRREWAHLVEGIEPKVRWPTLIPTALIGALAGWLGWTVAVRVLELRVTNSGLAFEGLLGFLASGAFFFTRRLLRRFHVERGVEGYVEEPPSKAQPPNEWVPALVLVGLVVFTGFTAATESAQLKAAILPLPTLQPQPRPKPPRPPPPRLDPFAGATFDVAAARRGVVLIKRSQLGVATSVGTGFIASTDGLVFTTRKIAEGNPTLWVGVASAGDLDLLDYYPAKQVYVAPESSQVDVAVLKIAGLRPFHVLAPAQVEVAPGDPVSVLGFPNVAEAAALMFTRSSVTATRVMWGDVPYVETAAAFDPGNSGAPLLDAKGNVVGIVAVKKDTGSLRGNALSLSALADLRARLKGLASEVTGVSGPVSLAAARVMQPSFQTWRVIQGSPMLGANLVSLQRNGGAFWASTNELLPQNFQLEVPCHVQYLRGDQVLPETQAHALRTLFVRFGEPDGSKAITDEGGYVFRFSQDRLFMKRGGESVGAASVGNPERSFTLVISRKGGAITFGVDDEVLMRFEDPQPLASGPLSIGGFLSAVDLGPLSVTDLGGN